MQILDKLGKLFVPGTIAWYAAWLHQVLNCLCMTTAVY